MGGHLARPGPMYWDFRCLICGKDVRTHTRWWKLLWRWISKEAD